MDLRIKTKEIKPKNSVFNNSFSSVYNNVYITISKGSRIQKCPILFEKPYQKLVLRVS